MYCDSYFNPKKQEASKLLNKYKITKDYKDIEKAFRLDNTNSDICYTISKSILKKKEYSSSNSIIKQILMIGGREKEEYDNLIKIAHVHPTIKITKLTRSSIVLDSEDKDRQKTKSRSFYLNKWCKRQSFSSQ